MVFPKFTTWCLVTVAIRVMFSLFKIIQAMHKCLLSARSNMFGSLLLAQKTHLFVLLRREKLIPGGAIQEWDKKNFFLRSCSFGEGGILRNNHLSGLQRSFECFWRIIFASLISQHSLLFYHLGFIII